MVLMKKKRYYCPRCGTSEVVENPTSFDCAKCQLEFDKRDFESIEDKSSILSIKEKLDFIDTFKIKDEDK